LSSPGGTIERVSTTVTAITRQRPAIGATNHEGLELDVVKETADDYDSAVAAIRERLPEDWQILSLRTY